MSEKKINKINSGKHRDLFSVFPLFFLFVNIFLFRANPVISQNNIFNQVYDINDPRNPDCPCHKRQKIAEEEYNQLTGKRNAKTVFFVGRKKKNSVYLNKIIFRYSHKMKGINRKRPDYSICFKW